MVEETPKSRPVLDESGYNLKFAEYRDKSRYKLRPSSSIKPAQAWRRIDEARFPHFNESFVEHLGSDLPDPSDDVDLDYCERETDEKEHLIDNKADKDDIISPASSTDCWVLPVPSSSSSKSVLAAFSPVLSAENVNDVKPSLLKRRGAGLEQDSVDIDQLSPPSEENQENSKRQRRS
jgi:hypothetical protein